jgi:hypothetical protein
MDLWDMSASEKYFRDGDQHHVAREKATQLMVRFVYVCSERRIEWPSVAGLWYDCQSAAATREQRRVNACKCLAPLSLSLLTSPRDWPEKRPSLKREEIAQKCRLRV